MRFGCGGGCVRERGGGVYVRVGGGGGGPFFTKKTAKPGHTSITFGLEVRQSTT